MTTPVRSARHLLLTMSSQASSTFGNQVVAFVIPWLVLDRTGSALNAGGVAFATGVAFVLGTLFGGVVVDRIGGRLTAMAADALSLVTVVALSVGLLADFVPLWLIVVTQVLGVAFDGPGMVARDTLIPAVARQDDVPLVRATSLQETLQSTASFVGPLAAGLLIASIGESPTLFLAAFLFLVALLLVARLERQRLASDHPLTPRSALDDLREGFAFIAREPLLGPLTFLLIGWTAIYVPLSTVIYPAWFVLDGRDAGALGIFLGAQALGGIVGGLAFAAVGPKVSKWRWVIVTNLVATAGLAALTRLEPGSAAAVVLSFAIGVISAGSLPIINTAYYARTPERLLGRVNGASFALVLTALPVSSLLMGWLINATSAVTALGVVVAGNAVMVLTFGLVPALRLIDQDEARAEEHEDEAAPEAGSGDEAGEPAREC